MKKESINLIVCLLLLSCCESGFYIIQSTPKDKISHEALYGDAGGLYTFNKIELAADGQSIFYCGRKGLTTSFKYITGEMDLKGEILWETDLPEGEYMELDFCVSERKIFLYGNRIIAANQEEEEIEESQNNSLSFIFLLDQENQCVTEVDFSPPGDGLRMYYLQYLSDDYYYAYMESSTIAYYFTLKISENNNVGMLWRTQTEMQRVIFARGSEETGYETIRIASGDNGGLKLLRVDIPANERSITRWTKTLSENGNCVYTNGNFLLADGKIFFAYYNATTKQSRLAIAEYENLLSFSGKSLGISSFNGIKEAPLVRRVLSDGQYIYLVGESFNDDSGGLSATGRSSVYVSDKSGNVLYTNFPEKKEGVGSGFYDGKVIHNGKSIFLAGYTGYIGVQKEDSSNWFIPHDGCYGKTFSILVDSLTIDK